MEDLRWDRLREGEKPLAMGTGRGLAICPPVRPYTANPILGKVRSRSSPNPTQPRAASRMTSFYLVLFLSPPLLLLDFSPLFSSSSRSLAVVSPPPFPRFIKLKALVCFVGITPLFRSVLFIYSCFSYSRLSLIP